MTAAQVRPALPAEDVVLSPPTRRPAKWSGSGAIGTAAVRLHVVSHGGAAGPSVLLLHGAGTGGRLWRDVQYDLGPAVHSVAPDLLGYGASERPADGAVGPVAHSSTLVSLLDHLGIARCCIVGHGVGGAVGVHLAAHHPDRVSGLVLVAAPLHPGVWPPRAVRAMYSPGADLLSRYGRRSRRLVRAVLAATAGSDAVAGPVEEEFVDALQTRDGARGLVSLVRGLDMHQIEFSWRLLRVDAPPILFVWGTADPVVPVDYGRRLASSMPGCGWVPVAGGGHLLPLERPERLAEEIAAFVGQLPARRRA